MPLLEQALEPGHVLGVDRVRRRGDDVQAVLGEDVRRDRDVVRASRPITLRISV
jgi:hypothetical protein